MARNRKCSDKCPATILESTDRSVLCEWLCKFISGMQKSDGTEYTPRSLYLLLTGIQRKLRSNYPTEEISLFHDPLFKPLKNVCDSVFRRLHKKGIGTDKKSYSSFIGYRRESS